MTANNKDVLIASSNGRNYILKAIPLANKETQKKKGR